MKEKKSIGNIGKFFIALVIVIVLSVVIMAGDILLHGRNSSGEDIPAMFSDEGYLQVSLVNTSPLICVNCSYQTINNYNSTFNETWANATYMKKTGDTASYGSTFDWNGSIMRNISNITIQSSGSTDKGILFGNDLLISRGSEGHINFNFTNPTDSNNGQLSIGTDPYGVEFICNDNYQGSNCVFRWKNSFLLNDDKPIVFGGASRAQTYYSSTNYDSWKFALKTGDTSGIFTFMSVAYYLSPSDKMDDPTIRIYANGTGATREYIQFYHSGDSDGTGDDNGYIETGVGDIILMPNSTYVGINNKTPGEALDVNGNVRADAFIEYSDKFEGDAISLIKAIQPEGSKCLEDIICEVNHSTLPSFVQHSTTIETPIGTKTIEKYGEYCWDDYSKCPENDNECPAEKKCTIGYYNISETIYETHEEIGRDIGASVQLNLRAIEQLIERVEYLEAHCIIK